LARAPVAPENCPDPTIHESFRYCPYCSWIEPPDPDGWRADLEKCAGTIVGVEIAHPNNHALEVAAQPFLDYVKGLSGSPEKEGT
jgi:hypothetical protein